MVAQAVARSQVSRGKVREGLFGVSPKLKSDGREGNKRIIFLLLYVDFVFVRLTTSGV
jgi:hypothetical protein